jgi:hypothetical protein
MLEVGGLIKAFPRSDCAGILCLIIKFAIMTYFSGIKISSLPESGKNNPYNVIH